MGRPAKIFQLELEAERLAFFTYMVAVANKSRGTAYCYALAVCNYLEAPHQQVDAASLVQWRESLTPSNQRIFDPAWSLYCSFKGEKAPVALPAKGRSIRPATIIDEAIWILIGDYGAKKPKRGHDGWVDGGRIKPDLLALMSWRDLVRDRDFRVGFRTGCHFVVLLTEQWGALGALSAAVYDHPIRLIDRVCPFTPKQIYARANAARRWAATGKEDPLFGIRWDRQPVEFPTAAFALTDIPLEERIPHIEDLVKAPPAERRITEAQQEQARLEAEAAEIALTQPNPVA